MVDIQNSVDERDISLNCVGVENHILQTIINSENTVSSVNLGVSLDKKHKGIHMSRLCVLLEKIKTIDNECILNLLLSAKQSHCAETSQVLINTVYFRKKVAPVSRIIGTVNYDITIKAILDSNNKFTIFHSISIPITSLCPCSKAISKYGAHNQRGIVIATFINIDVSEYEKIINIIENMASSCDIYSVLKRTDEKYVTELAYNNPKFVEDIVRDATIGLQQEYNANLISIKCVNFESIHNHNAFAYYSTQSYDNLYI